MRHIYLIRHCKANGQEPDAHLTEEGCQQAKKLSVFFADKKIDLIISSPYIRAIETIRPLAESIGMEIILDDRLKERLLSSNDLADWMDRLREAFEKMDLKFEGGESSYEAMSRGLEAINDVLKRPENNIVMVTHGNLMSLILKYYENSIGFDEWMNLTNPDVYELCISNDKEAVEIRRLWKL
jgi:2,3-bisphosphoglycerate-dependent phosphoglycerate mutase